MRIFTVEAQSFRRESLVKHKVLGDSLRAFPAFDGEKVYSATWIILVKLPSTKGGSDSLALNYFVYIRKN